MITSEKCLLQFKEEYSFRLTDGTLLRYIIAMEQLIDFCNKSIYEIDSKDIRRWMSSLDNKAYKAVTVKTKLAGIKLFFKYCVEDGFLVKNPAINIPFPKVEDKSPIYLQKGDLLQLRQLVKGKLEERAVIEVLYASGVRIKELTEIKREDINWPERMIIIPNGKHKKERIVLFTQECAEHLKSYLNERDDELPFVFVNTSKTGSMCTRIIQKKFKYYSNKLNIHLTPHTLRHTFAAHLAMKGMPLECIQVLLGHNGPHQTQLYARLYHEARKAIYDQLM